MSIPRNALCIVLLAAVGCTSRDDSTASGNAPAVPTAPAADASPGESLVVAEDGFTILTLEDFDFFHGKGAGQETTWAADGTTITCTGKPRGYAYTKQSYRDFTLRVDFRFIPPADADAARLESGNTGVLCYISGKHKLWPVSLEVQGKQVEMASIKPNGGAATVEIDDDEQARQQVRKSVGEWNSLEIISRDGGLTSILNGTKICKSRPGELKEGAIGLQSEDFAVEFRNLRVRRE